MVQWPEQVDLRVLNQTPLPVRYEITAQGRRLGAANVEAVAEIESLIWRQYWDLCPRLEQDWARYVERMMPLCTFSFVQADTRRP
jgi:hypothetical protein